MRYGPNELSSHPYEVQEQRDEDGKIRKMLVFYLRQGEPVNIKFEAVLKRTGLWRRPPPGGSITDQFQIKVLPSEHS